MVRRVAAVGSRFVGRLLGLAIVMGAGVAGITLCLTLLGSGLAGIGSAVSVTPPQRPAFRELKQRSVVFDRNGRQIAVFRSNENRKTVSLDSVPQHLIDAVIAVEDANFYAHKGFNAKSMGRAMLQNLQSGEVEQGGSTITQQLVKIDLLTRAQKLDRKVREARYAVQLEKELTKEEILERYLNSVYFGGGAYGVEAAANHYFGKPVGRLEPVESAFIAGMIRNPTGYDPVRFRDRSRTRRSVVLSRLVAVGKLDAADAEVLARAPMPFPESSDLETEERSSYFVEQVKQELLDDARLGDTPGERYQAVFNGGLRIYTTFDPKLQSAAEGIVADAIPEKVRDTFTASLVSVDVDTAAVRAMVSGRGFETDQFNLVTQARRQPGSSWKPFTLIAALEAGNPPTAIISGVEPCPIPNPEGDPNPYLPANYDGANGFVGTLSDQLINSSNCAYARLAHVIGNDKVISVAKRLGISTTIEDVPAMALGTEEVRPIDMVGAYATIAREGEYLKPYFIERVEDQLGNVLWRAPRVGRRVLRQDVARAATQAMRDVVRRGTGTAAAIGEDRQVAGKTGTTQNYEDAWFVGYTSEIATAVWMGNPDAKEPMTNVGGSAVTGGSYPARIWHDYMVIASENTDPADFGDWDKDSFDRAECLKVERPKGAARLSTKDAADRERARQKKQRSTDESAVGPALGGTGGRFSVLASVDDSSSTKKQSTKNSSKQSTRSGKQSTKQKSVSGCDSWGGSGGGSSSSSSSSSTKKKTTKSTTRKKRTAVTEPDNDDEQLSSQLRKTKKIPKKKTPAKTAPAPAPEPVPVPVEAPPAEPAPAPAPEPVPVPAAE
jgi:penicillin-binding protein 1A